MKKYVYPKGIAGELLGQMVSYVYDCEICFIDDSCIDTSLESFKHELIANDETIFLAWDKRSTLNDSTARILIDKLNVYGIRYYDDSFFMVSKMLANKLYNQIKDKKWDKVVAIEVSGMANDKHIGFLDDCLMRNDMKILYLCGTNLAYNRVINKIKTNNLEEVAFAVCMPCYYLELIDFVRCITKVSWTYKNNYIPTICIGHSLSDFSNINLDLYSKNFDYLCISGKCYMPNNSAGGGGFGDSYL